MDFCCETIIFGSSFRCNSTTFYTLYDCLLLDRGHSHFAVVISKSLISFFFTFLGVDTSKDSNRNFVGHILNLP